MPFRRHDHRWRLSAVRRPFARLLATAGITAALLAPGLAASASVLPATASGHAALPGPTPQSVAVLDAKPAPPPASGEPNPPWTGVTSIHVEDGKIQDWQAMLVAAGGASLLLFLAGKVRKK